MTVRATRDVPKDTEVSTFSCSNVLPGVVLNPLVLHTSLFYFILIQYFGFCTRIQVVYSFLPFGLAVMCVIHQSLRAA